MISSILLIRIALRDEVIRGTPKYNSDASAQPKLADAGAVIYACHRTIWGDDCQLSIEVAGGSQMRIAIATFSQNHSPARESYDGYWRAIAESLMPVELVSNNSNASGRL